MLIRIFSRRLALYLGAFLLLCNSSMTIANNRIALIIGNGNYQYTSSLENPEADARLVAKTLRSLNFEVIELINAKQKDMKRAINFFGEKLEKSGRNTVGLFYYAGHGVQVDGQNYLIPVNANIEKESQVDIESLNTDFVMKTMEYAGNGINFIILDACRNNPYKSGFRSASRGLAKITAPTGTLVAYATSPGDVASDGHGINSPYTRALVSSMLKPNLLVEQVFKKVRIAVMEETGRAQVPWELSSLTGDFYFKKEKNKSISKNTSYSNVNPIDRELAFWMSIKDSNDSSDFLEYLKRYEKGTYAGIAKRRLNSLIINTQNGKDASDSGVDINEGFTKLDAKGRPLSNDAENWSCVIDSRSGLIWEKKSLSGKRNRNTKYTWEASIKYSKQINNYQLCGKTGWGVPNKGELESIVKALKASPYDYVKYFPNTRPGWYWSATSGKHKINYAYGWSFNSGESGLGGKGNKNYVRLVRTADDVK